MLYYKNACAKRGEDGDETKECVNFMLYTFASVQSRSRLLFLGPFYIVINLAISTDRRPFSAEFGGSSSGCKNEHRRVSSLEGAEHR